MIGCRCSGLSRKQINSSRVSTSTPVSSRSIICSSVNPACSPAAASFEMARTNEVFSIIPLPLKLLEDRISWWRWSVMNVLTPGTDPRIPWLTGTNVLNPEGRGKMSRVENRRSGVSLPVAVDLAFASSPQSGLA